MQLHPCTCGRTKIGKMFDHEAHRHFYQCQKCFKRGPNADTDLLARKGWNNLFGGVQK